MKKRLSPKELGRRQVRFKPDEDTLARIDFNADMKKFDPQKTGLTFSESFGGCGVAVLNNYPYQVGQPCCVQIGSLGPMLAEIAWVKETDSDLVKIGIRYLE